MRRVGGSNSSELNKVWEIQALKRKPNPEEAKKILERIAKEVQPIMIKHNWRVKVLSEMCPKRRGLLGLNVGAGINVKLTLRRPNNDSVFFPYHELLDTMLHELCHNAHGPHNAQFYKLWDELRVEYEELLAKGITGSRQGFDLPGKKLGGFAPKPPLSALGKTARDAAEKRKQLNSLLPSGPKRLGGDSRIMAALTPVQAAAMAAERRYHDEIWCASQSSEVFDDGTDDNSFITEELVNVKQNTQSSRPSCDSSQHNKPEVSRKRDACKSPNKRMKSKIVDLTEEDSPPSTFTHNYENRSQKRSRLCDGTSSSDYLTKSHSVSNTTLTGSILNSHDARDQEKTSMWECKTCTFFNRSLALMCEICHTLKPKDMDASCKIWQCRFCTLENSVDFDKCSVCDQWRYSNGPPASSKILNLGT
ncbi:hypothetical protein ACFE04_024017 [Oxalis oulophora]